MATPVLGITGTGGAGKSSLTDELVRRIRTDQRDALSIALISIDPSRRKSGGALLSDRIRMNAIHHPRIFMRSLATRAAGGEISPALPEVIAACKVAGFDLIWSRLPASARRCGHRAACRPDALCDDARVRRRQPARKIDMLDFADFVAINKFDRKGAQDAWRDVAKQVQRNRAQWHAGRKRCRSTARRPRVSTTMA